MKKYLLMFVFAACSLAVQAQSIDDVPLSSIDVEYLQIVGMSKFMSNKVTIAIDYGQERKLMTDTRVKDKNDKVMNFNSMIDALNFMEENGYEFVNAYAISTSNQNVYHYMLRKKS